MTTVIEVSSSFLSLPGSYQPTFGPLPLPNVDFYDDGPHAPVVKQTQVSASGSMSTVNVDAYVQGVEITRQAQYDAGMVKIWSGEPRHALKINTFGQDNRYFPDVAYTDIDLFEPVPFIEAQAAASPLWSPVWTYPIVTADNDQLANYNFNGTIEPLSIRPVASFFSTEAPFIARSIKADIMAGNSSRVFGDDRTLTVDYFDPAFSRQQPGFLDAVDASGTLPSPGFFQFRRSVLAPFIDARYNRNTTQNSASFEPADMLEAMDMMTGSTDNYVRFDQRSATCGFTYDNTVAIGIDALPFGGMTY